jgi:hypothetical protein
MATNIGPSIVTDGLIYYLDPANTKSYPSTGVDYKDLTGRNSGLLVGTIGYNPVGLGCFDTKGATVGTPTWISTTNNIVFVDQSEYTMEFTVKMRENTTSLNSLCGPGATWPWVMISCVSTPSQWKFSFRQTGGNYFYGATVSNYDLSKNWGLLSMVVKTDRTIQFYLNGKYISNVTGTTTVNPTTTQLTVSRVAGGYTAATDNNYPWQGLFSQTRFYNKALTAEEILQNYNAQNTRFENDIVGEGLNFYIDANDTRSFINTTTGWTDMAKNYGTLPISGASYTPDISRTLKFDGAAGSSASTSTIFTQNYEMTWDVWFNRTSSINQFNMIFSNNLLPYLSFRDSTNLNKILFSWYTTSATVAAGVPQQRTIISPISYSDNTWYNVVCTLVQDDIATTSTAKMYINGTLVTNLTTAAGTVDSVFQGGGLKMANYGPTGIYPFNGKISNLKIYKRILTDSEILQNYNAQKARFGY